MVQVVRRWLTLFAAGAALLAGCAALPPHLEVASQPVRSSSAYQARGQFAGPDSSSSSPRSPAAQLSPPIPATDDRPTSATQGTAGLKVIETGPTEGSVGVPVRYHLSVTNEGSAAAANVLLYVEFDAGLEHESKANPLEVPLGPLAAGQTRTVPLTLTPRQTGTLKNHVIATADGGLSASADRTLLVQQAYLSVQLSGPALRYVGRPAEWTIEVVNTADTPLEDVVVRDQLPPEVAFQEATANGQADGDHQVVWHLGTLAPHENQVLQVTGKCLTATGQAVNVALASAVSSSQVEDRATLEVRRLPPFRLQVFTLGSPLLVHGRTTYKIKVTKQAPLSDSAARLLVVLPKQLQLLNTDGPTRPVIEGNQVSFPGLEALAPEQTRTYALSVEAVEAGEARVRAELHSTALEEPVVTEESTNVSTDPFEDPAVQSAATPTPSEPPDALPPPSPPELDEAVTTDAAAPPLPSLEAPAGAPATSTGANELPAQDNPPPARVAQERRVPRSTLEPSLVAPIEADRSTDVLSQLRISLEPPGPQRLFRLESEESLHRRIGQEAPRRPYQPATFPEEPVLSPDPSPPTRTWRPVTTTGVPHYVCYQPLLFEQRASERYGWDLGAIQPVLSAGRFYFNLLTLPHQGARNPGCRCECSGGYCLPGDPVPLLLEPPGFPRLFRSAEEESQP